MVRYYGYYNNKSRGQRKKADQNDDIANIIEMDLSNKAFRKSWARLIQKVYEVDPLLCPKCQGQMKIISFIEEQAVIKQILQTSRPVENQKHRPAERYTPEYCPGTGVSGGA